MIDARIAEFRHAGADLAGNVFDLMRMPAYRDRIRQSPYPRRRHLLTELEGSKTLIEDGRYTFADPVTGARRTLADVT